VEQVRCMLQGGEKTAAKTGPDDIKKFGQG